MNERTPADVLARIRSPELIATEGYLNNPLQFTPDEKLIPETVLRQLESSSLVTRDALDYTVVNTNSSTPINYVVSMVTPVYTRVDLRRTIDTTFRSF